MSIDKQALREMAERAGSDSWGYDRDEFNDAITPEVVLALLDELEAKDATIAFQQHEIRTLLGRLENANRAAAAGKGATS
ncbi:ead/Ea22-like family protein [Citrobacter sp. wls829]|uniref:ead/Ea22-like family protein n=1 Tax=Citrobacter sp. wls829 TaxID=2576412 RepID=UPI002017A16D|nr:ead/Ea22-like family protein [Citrobacter sp. wls829]